MALEHLLDGLSVSVDRLTAWWMTHRSASRRFESTSPLGYAFLQKGKIKEKKQGKDKKSQLEEKEEELKKEWVGNTKTTRQLIPYSQPIVSDAGRLINIFPADSSILSFIVLFFWFVNSSCLLSTSHGTKFLVVSNDTRNLCINAILEKNF